MKNKAVIAGILLLVILGGIWFFYVNGSGGYNVILISLDTTRADHLSCYGYDRNTTPNIDKFASDSILFEQAISPVPITFPAHSSMFTGTNPLYHGVHSNLEAHLEDQNVTLAEILKDKGYKTAAIVSTMILNSKNGIAQGFDSYEDHDESISDLKEEDFAHGRLAEETSKLACEWLDKNSKDKFFLFVHYYDAHLSYAPPEPFASEYKDNLYAGEIAYMDKNIGTLFDKLKAKGLYDKSLIIVVGDHGEMLGEHGEIEHSYYIYESSIKVPFIVKPSGKVNPTRVKENVGLIDIAPTVCSLLGIKAEQEFNGEDITKFFDGKSVRQEKQFYYIESLTPTKFEFNSLLGVMEGNWKYIQTTQPELYNVVKDRAEENNLVDQESNRARLMKEHLQIILEEQVRKSEGPDKEFDSDSIEQLASLGYVGGGVDETFEFDQSKPDPKGKVRIHEKFKTAMKHFAKKEYDQSLKLGDEIRKELPFITLAHDLAGNIALERGDAETAIANYSKALDLQSENTKLMQKLAVCYHQNKQIEESAATWKSLLAIEPDNVEALNNYAIDMVSLEKFKLAIESWKQSLAIEPAQPEIHNKLAKVFYFDGEFESVVYHWEQALKLKSDWAEVLNDLSWVYATEKDPKIYNPQKAVSLAIRACELTNYAEAGYLDTLSVAYAEIGSYNNAVKYGELAIKLFKVIGEDEEAKQTAERINVYK